MREAIRRVARELPAIAAVQRVDSLNIAASRARAAATLKKPPSALQFEQIDAPLVLGFLSHLETARRARWDIEMFFNVLKNGCCVESMQPGSIEGLERALALYMIVAWRIAHLMRLGRTCPESDADLFFCSADEIRGAYLLTSTKPPPERKPTLNEVLRLVARLGGFIGRKSNGEPDMRKPSGSAFKRSECPLRPWPLYPTNEMCITIWAKAGITAVLVDYEVCGT